MVRSIVWSHNEKTELTKYFKLTHLNKVVINKVVVVVIIIIIIIIIVVVVVIIVFASSLGFRRLLMFLQ